MVSYLCESIPCDSEFGDNSLNEYLSCNSFTTEKLEGYFFAKLQENRDRQSEVETEMLTKRSDCDVQKDLVTTHICETE